MYPPKGHLPRLSGSPAKVSAVAQMGARDKDDFLLRKLQSERAFFSVIPIDWPEYMSVRDLPFQQLLNVSAR
jgi:hypothetical protein